MISTFKRWVRNWANDDEPTKNYIRKNNEPDTEASLSFRVWFATGGRVVQTHRYDRNKDITITSMYVVTTDQDFGEEINKIITMEGLRS